MPKQVDPHGNWEVRLDLECILCTRTVATAQGPAGQPFVPTSIHVQRPEHAEAVQQLRCPYCSGRMWLANREEVFVYAGHRRSRGASAS